MMHDDGWKEWSRYVLEELKRLNSKMERMEKEVHEIKVEVNTLKTKSALWGSMAGVVVTLLGFLLSYLKDVK